MTYELRDERGVLRMRISDTRMSAIMTNGYGIFRPSKVDSSIFVYEITEDFKWALPDGFTIYVWKEEVFKKVKCS